MCNIIADIAYRSKEMPRFALTRFKKDTRARLYRRHLVGRDWVLSFMTLAELDQWAEAHNWGHGRRVQRDTGMEVDPQDLARGLPVRPGHLHLPVDALGAKEISAGEKAGR